MPPTPRDTYMPGYCMPGGTETAVHSPHPRQCGYYVLCLTVACPTAGERRLHWLRRHHCLWRPALPAAPALPRLYHPVPRLHHITSVLACITFSSRAFVPPYGHRDLRHHVDRGRRGAGAVCASRFELAPRHASLPFPASGVHWTHVQSSPVQSSPVQSSPVQSSPVQSSQVENSRAESSRVESNRIESSRVQSSRVQPVQLESSRHSRVQSSPVESSPIESRDSSPRKTARPNDRPCRALCASRALTAQPRWHRGNGVVPPSRLSRQWRRATIPTASAGHLRRPKLRPSMAPSLAATTSRGET